MTGSVEPISIAEIKKDNQRLEEKIDNTSNDSDDFDDSLLNLAFHVAQTHLT